MKLKEVLLMEDKMPITEVTGVCEKVFKATNGGEGQKAWTKQEFTLADGPSKCYVTVWNYPGTLENWEGKRVRLRSKKGNKGYEGLSVDVYNGKTKIRMSQSGILEVDDGTQPEKPLPQGNAPVDSRVERDPVANTPMSAKQSLYQSGQAYIDVIGAAKYVVSQALAQHEVNIGPDHFQALCATLFIKLDKSGLIYQYPTHPQNQKENDGQ